jgi:hypothetical protein
MTSHRPSVRLATPSFLLALALISGSAAPAIARNGSDGGGVFGGSDRRDAPRAHGSAADPTVAPAPWLQAELARPERSLVEPQAAVRPPTPDVPVAKAVAIPKAAADSTGSGATTAATTSYRGRNHVWIPSLGVSKSIAFFACTSKAYPGDRVYRWGCAGSNNVYLFGHAHSVFKPLHDAYVSGRLRKGMALHYAGNDGVVHTYTVRWWRVTTPDKGAWAFASQSAPSLTLQTCVGAKSQFRLVVRLVRED